MPAARRLYALVNAAHFLDHYCLLILPTAAIAMPVTFGAGYAERLGLGVGMTLAFGFGHLPWGWLADRVPRLLLLRLFLLGSGAAALLLATAQDAWQFGLLGTLLGLMLAIYHTIGTPLVVATMGRTGRYFGINGMCGNAGVATAALGSAALIALGGWRLCFAVPGMAALLLGLVSLRLVETAPVAQAEAEPQDVTAGGSRRALIVLALSALLGGLLFQAVTFALPKLLAELAGGGDTGLLGVGMLVALVTSVGAVAQLTVGRLTEWLPSGRLFQLLNLAMVLGIGLMVGGHPVAVPVGAGLTMLALFGLFTVEDGMLMTVLPPAWRSRGMALICLASFCTSGLALPLVAWSRGAGSDFQLLGLILLAVAMLNLLAGLGLPRRLTGPPGILRAAEAELTDGAKLAT